MTSPHGREHSPSHTWRGVVIIRVVRVNVVNEVTPHLPLVQVKYFLFFCVLKEGECETTVGTTTHTERTQHTQRTSFRKIQKYCVCESLGNSKGSSARAISMSVCGMRETKETKERTLSTDQGICSLCRRGIQSKIGVFAENFHFVTANHSLRRH